MSATKCRGCFYFGYRTRTCDYILLTGQRRGCPVDACDKRVPNKSVQALVKFYDGGELPEKDRLLLQLYEQGLNDSQIAELVGESRKLVCRWRLKMGLPSQKEIAEAADENRDNHLPK